MKISYFNFLNEGRKKTLLSLLLFCSMSIGFAQISISGKITDAATNQPLPGASILIKDTTTGTQTDFDGNFNIEAASGDILVISYLGFVTQEIVITEETTLSIALQEDTNTLDEIVVIGYGRNEHTINELNKHGFDVLKAQDIIKDKIKLSDYQKYVITIEGSELARGGGGARCMTMPMARKAVDW
jgi:hypothetical protein